MSKLPCKERSEEEREGPEDTGEILHPVIESSRANGGPELYPQYELAWGKRQFVPTTRSAYPGRNWIKQGLVARHRLDRA
jgi:hypothetical protein